MPGRPGLGAAIAAALAVGLAFALALGVGALSRSRGWGPQGQATALPQLGAEVLFFTVPEIVTRGPPRLVVVRFCSPVQLVPYHYASAGLGAPLPVEDWAERLGAQVVFNAGQFDHERQHLGWLKGQGVWLSGRRKRDWMGLLVSGPLAPGPWGQVPWGQVVDLQLIDPQVVDSYAHALQSMMLVDDAAQVRVRRSGRAACRTVVAQDVHGRLLVVATEGAVTLWQLAAWLPASGLDVVRAMNLDGGVESQLAIHTPELKLTFYGQYGVDPTLPGPRWMTRAPLPAVVGVWPAAAQPPVAKRAPAR